MYSPDPSGTEKPVHFMEDEGFRISGLSIVHNIHIYKCIQDAFQGVHRVRFQLYTITTYILNSARQKYWWCFNLSTFTPTTGALQKAVKQHRLTTTIMLSYYLLSHNCCTCHVGIVWTPDPSGCVRKGLMKNSARKCLQYWNAGIGVDEGKNTTLSDQNSMTGSEYTVEHRNFENWSST